MAKKNTTGKRLPALTQRPALPELHLPQDDHDFPPPGEIRPAQAVYGADQGGGYGVQGYSESGMGVYGISSGGRGVYGETDAAGGVGVGGVNTGTGYGVVGQNPTGHGVAVFGYSHDGTGVWGQSASGWAGRFTGAVNISGDASISGSLGVGTLQPEGALDVHGDAHVTGDLHVTGNLGTDTLDVDGDVQFRQNLRVTGDVFLIGADCAEDFEIAGEEAILPGTVMVIDDEGALRPSTHAYDRRVAGVISGAGDLRPGLTLGKQANAAGRLPLALIGRVYCRVDARDAPVAIGDLLTTSPTAGHAMKATDASRAFGAVLGKALRRLDSGVGLLPILVALQ